MEINVRMFDDEAEAYKNCQVNRLQYVKEIIIDSKRYYIILTEKLEKKESVLSHANEIAKNTRLEGR